MNDATHRFTAEPSLADRLRYIDLSLECMAEARRQLPSAGVYFSNEIPPRNLARESVLRQLRIAAVLREGLPLTVLPKADRDEAARIAA